MRIAVDINDVVTAIFHEKINEVHVILNGPSALSLWSAWQEMKREEDSHPQFDL